MIITWSLLSCANTPLNAQQFEWAISMGANINDIGHGIAVDANENVYTTGRFLGTVDFDPGAGVANQTAAGSSDIFIQKVDVNGDLVWIKTMGAAFFDIGEAIALDDSANVYVTGVFQDTVDFDPGAGVTELISEGSQDVFILKLNSSGDFQWARSLGGSSIERGNSIAIDHSGNVLVTGSFRNTADLDPGSGVQNETAVGVSDAFVLKLDATGGFIWAKAFGGFLSDIGQSIAVDHSNNIYSTGYFLGNVDFDPGAGTTTAASVGSEDVYIQKLDSSGNFEWVRTFGGSQEERGEGLVIGLNSLYTTGTFEGTVDFDPGSGTNNQSSNGIADVFIQKLTLSGDHVWTRTIGGISLDEARQIASDHDENLYTIGIFREEVDFDPGAGTDTLVATGVGDIFIHKLDSNGLHDFAVHMGASGLDQGYAIALDPATNIYSTGLFYNTVDFDPGIGVHNLSAVANADIFVQKLNQCVASGSTDTVVACDSYTWIDGNTYTASNTTATDTLINASGCDSIVTLDLTILNASSSIDTIEACDSYTWIDGTTYNTSNNTATDTLVNAVGCDSVVTLNLTLLSSTSFTDTVFACGSFTWIDGNVYNSGNSSATHIIPNSAGCDSTITLNLTIAQPSFATDTIVACDSYTWIDGNTYTSSNNTATDTLINAAGCDSIITLDLIILNSSSSIDSVTSCDSYTWIDGNTYTTSNNTATDTFSNAAGCDSVVTLNLTILQSTSFTDSVFACDSYTWIDGNTYTASNNTATFTLPNAAGCDSVVTLNLTIGQSTTGTDVITACDSFTWIDGNTYTQSNSTATDTLTNVAGCDSVVTLNLTVNSSSTGSQTEVVCDSYTWPANAQTYTTSGSYTTTLTNTAGCDSVVTLNLTINSSNTGSQTEAACDSYTWPVNAQTYTTSGSYTTILTNAAGCDSTITLDLTINETPDNTITLSGVNLTSNAVGADYQWFVCTDSLVGIPGETEQIFIASVNGAYAVEVILNGCSDTSACVNVTSVGVAAELYDNELTIFPNPTTGTFEVAFSAIQPSFEVMVQSLTGQIIERKTFHDVDRTPMPAEYPSGIYLLNVRDAEGRNKVFRLVVQ